MAKIDSNKMLQEKPFSYRLFKNGKVSISRNGKNIMILKGKKADNFSNQIEDANESEEQLIMAKITGNFKRGNERDAKLIARK